MVKHQIISRDCPTGANVNKRQIVAAVRIASRALGVALSRVGLLEKLVSFHPGENLIVGENLVVFPSNRSLAARAIMSASSVTRGLADLVRVGLILRRDSPNGKRYARKGAGGVIEQAFGFDLTPLVARAEEVQRLAAEVEQEDAELKRLRLAISVNQRDIRKMLRTALDEGVPGDWAAFEESFAPLAPPLSRSIGIADAAMLASALNTLLAAIRSELEKHVKSLSLSSSAAQTEQHIQNSKKDPFFESEDGQPISSGAGHEPFSASKSSPPPAFYPLALVLDACPDIVDYARHGVASWRDFIATAAYVCAMLGISPSAWQDAVAVLGPQNAAAVVAAIVQRSDAINCPGGYLRSLTNRARTGAFSLGPMLTALTRKKLRDVTSRKLG
jgi:replication initiation protein RepC